jgi:cytochrome c oxidase assembly factor CtaG
VQSTATAALSSWPLDGRVIALFLLSAVIYLRGWLRGRRLLRDHNDGLRLTSFIACLFVLFIANESPLDAFDSLFLSAHMAQHLLLIMIAPPLLLLSYPLLPMLRGLPKGFVKEGLGPFLSWKPFSSSPPALCFGTCPSCMSWLCRLPRGTACSTLVSSGQAYCSGGP